MEHPHQVLCSDSKMTRCLTSSPLVCFFPLSFLIGGDPYTWHFLLQLQRIHPHSSTPAPPSSYTSTDTPKVVGWLCSGVCMCSSGRAGAGVWRPPPTPNLAASLSGSGTDTSSGTRVWEQGQVLLRQKGRQTGQLPASRGALCGTLGGAVRTRD